MEVFQIVGPFHLKEYWGIAYLTLPNLFLSQSVENFYLSSHNPIEIYVFTIDVQYQESHSPINSGMRWKADRTTHQHPIC